jgi:glucokinase
MVANMIGAIDVGGTKIAVGIIDLDGHVLAKKEYPSSPVPEAHEGILKMAQVLRELVNLTQCSIQGIGMGVTGPIDPRTGVIGPNEFLKKWTGANLINDLSQLSGLPVAAENDADAAALGEALWGAGKGVSRFIYLTISTGIGGGIILDGKLYRGVDGSHPEVGHHIIEPAGPKCFCGASGCWESLASGPSMARWVKLNAPPGYRLLENLDAASICAMAVQGDRLAQRAVEREGFYLGIGLANLIDIFTPEVIALGGGVMKSWDLFTERAQQVIRQSCGLVPSAKTRLVRSLLGVDTGLVGAACTWLHRYGREQLTI